LGEDLRFDLFEQRQLQLQRSVAVARLVEDHHVAAEHALVGEKK